MNTAGRDVLPRGFLPNQNESWGFHPREVTDLQVICNESNGSCSSHKEKLL
jgi:hypothetical protein